MAAPGIITALLAALETTPEFRIVTPPSGWIAAAEGPHLHPYWELKFPCCGPVELVPPEVVHRSSGHGELLAVVDVAERDFSVSREQDFCLCQVNMGPAAPVLTGLLDLCRKVPAADAALRAVLFAEFVKGFRRILKQALDDPAPQNDPYRRAVAYLELHSHEPELSIADLADFMAVSPQYLNRLFRRNGETSARQELLKIRLTRARTLLQKGFSVTETATLTGWHGPFHFSRMFKRYFGVAPSALRASGEAVGDRLTGRDGV